jgi:hypothetical protein
LIFYTRSTYEMDLEAVKSEQLVRPTKVGEKQRKRYCQGGEEKEGDQRDLCNYCMS